MISRARVRGEEGQIIPPLLVVLVLCMAFGFMMLQVGLAADYKSRSQTAADAAALAGAVQVKIQIIAAYAEDHQLQPEEINMGLVCAAAALYAERNRATITDCEHDQYDIKVQVIGNDDLQQIGDTKDVKGDRAAAKPTCSMVSPRARHSSRTTSSSGMTWPLSSRSPGRRSLSR